MTNRREFMKASAGMAALSLSAGFWAHRAMATTTEDTLAKAALAAGQNKVVMAMGTGIYLDTLRELFFTPFTEETGIEVIFVGGSYDERFGKLKAMTETGAIDWDIISTTYDAIGSPSIAQFMTELGDNCSDLPDVVAQGLDGTCLGNGILFESGGSVLTYDNRAFPNGGPQNWRDFWDVKHYPGPRALPNYGNPWVNLIVALEADGVAPDKLFPMDIDRAFKKLDELRPNISVWWTSGNQSQQIFRDQEVVASLLWNGRAESLKKEGVPVSFIWDGAPLDASAWGVIKGAPHPLAAKALLNYTYSRPEAHAEFAKRMNYAPPNKNATKFLDADLAKSLVSAPENWNKIVKIDASWLAEHKDEVVKRWTAWISE